MNSIIKNERLIWVDALKFVAIFWIYLGHFGDNGGALFPFVFTFHVQLFFFISGLFHTGCKNFKELPQAIIKNFRRIMVPYFVFSLISLVLFTLYNKWNASEVYYNSLKIFFGIRNDIFAASLWFLPCLFSMVVIYSLITLLIKNKTLIYIVCAIFTFVCIDQQTISHPSVFWNIDSAFGYIFYYATGVFFAKFIINKFNRVETLTHSHNIIFHLVILSSALFLMVVYFWGVDVMLSITQNNYLKSFLLMLIPLVLFIPNIYISQYLCFSPLIVLGQSTLVLCGTEQIFKTAIYSFFNMFGLSIYLHNPLDTIMYTIMCFMISYLTVVRFYNYTRSR